MVLNRKLLFLVGIIWGIAIISAVGYFQLKKSSEKINIIQLEKKENVIEDEGRTEKIKFYFLGEDRKSLISREEDIPLYSRTKDKVRKITEKSLENLWNVKVLKNSQIEIGNIFIIGDRSILSKEGTETPIIVGPSEWLGLFLKARYVVTDSFHGTAFSINFNIPFTTLVNPVSNMNSRVLSILTITKLMGRIVYDGKKIKIPEVLNIDFSEVNEIIDSWRKKSFNFLYLSLKNESIN